MRAQGLEEMILVIDEIQKLKNWSEYVKKEWDADSLNRINLKVVLLGSSRVLLEKGLAESLMGRYEEVKSNAESHTTGLERFHRLFNPLATIIVGGKGIKPEVFLSMDLQKLFE